MICGASFTTLNGLSVTVTGRDFGPHNLDFLISNSEEGIMPTRRIILTDQQEALICCLLSNGRYHSADEILHDGLRMVERREASNADKQKALRLDTDVGRGVLHDNGYAIFSAHDCWITQPNWPQEKTAG